MNVFQIAWKSVKQRRVASLLTGASMALGVMLVVVVLSIHGVVAQQFRANSSLGYNLVVGATKGGRLQLTLNSVFYLSQPVENIDYRYYLEFASEQERLRTWGYSLRAQQLLEPGESMAPTHLEQLEVPLRGKFADQVDFAVPLCLGDYFGRFRVIGTTPGFFEHLVTDSETLEGFHFAAGRSFETWNEEHGFFEAVVGATVARELNIKVGDHISPAHGDPEGDAHGQFFHCTGVLAPSGTPHDRAVFVNMEGFLLLEGHEKPLEGEEAELAQQVQAAEGGEGDGGSQSESQEGEQEGEHNHAEEPGAHFKITKALDLEKREVTAVLVKSLDAFTGMNLKYEINQGQDAQCAQPMKQIFDLLDLMVRPIQWVLLMLTGIICLVSGISILVSIYNSMSERRHEIAVMRALGANRLTVTTIVMLEAIILSLGGGMAGWVLGHSLNVLASDAVEQRTGVRLGFFDFAPPIDLTSTLGMDNPSEFVQFFFRVSPELLLIPALILLAVLVGLLPAVSAYRTSVARWLGK